MLPTSPCPDPLFLCNRACFRTACHSALTSESAESDTKRFLFAEKLIQISKRQDWTPKAEFCGLRAQSSKDIVWASDRQVVIGSLNCP